MSAFSQEGTVAIIGAGPAGLAAAAELVRRGLRPIVIEAEEQVGGISKTVVHAGNRMDIGGHRFFSKSQRVMDWWIDVMPLQGAPSRDDLELGRRVMLAEDGPDPSVDDIVMLHRHRLSRIYSLGTFFDYPLSLNSRTLRSLGAVRAASMATSYIQAVVHPARPERSLEDFMVNRFGRQLYETFFREYTEKVWGVPCSEIAPEWGAQRIKGLSVSSALRHAVVSTFRRDDSVSQTGTETSLIGRFMYPKFGPGQLWETVAERAASAGATILMRHQVRGIVLRQGRVTALKVRDIENCRDYRLAVDTVMSTMPLRDLVAAVEGDVPDVDVREAAASLPYRDFITCGLLVDRLALTGPGASSLQDNWIYIQDGRVRLGRVQLFNNWSPYLVADPRRVWLGLEYFANEGDDLWSMDDAAFAAMAEEEIARIGLIHSGSALDSRVLRVKKAYPAYHGGYARFDVVRGWLDSVENLVVMGRNGMHRYNNMDHSMLSAWAAVDYLSGEGPRDAVWSINAEDDYHEGAH